MKGSQTRRILIVRLGALGDILHALPAQQQLFQRLAETEIHWIAEPAYEPLLKAVPGIFRVWIADTKKWRKNPLRALEVFSLIRELRRYGFEAAFDFQGLYKSALLTRLSGSGRVFGFQPERFKEPGTQWFYTEAAPGEADLNRHVIEGNLELVGRFIPTSSPAAVVPVAIPQSDQSYVDARLAELSIERPILLNPGAGWATKTWPVSRYARLGSEITRRTGLPAVYTYGPGEEPLIDEIRHALSPQPVNAFPTTILQLAALCRRSSLMVAGDSGPLHLAVTMGTPAVAIMGPTAPKRNGPFNTLDIAVKRDVPCANSYKRTCSNCVCMDIAVEQVLDGVLERLKRFRASSPSLEPALSQPK